MEIRYNVTWIPESGQRQQQGGMTAVEVGRFVLGLLGSFPGQFTKGLVVSRENDPCYVLEFLGFESDRKGEGVDTAMAGGLEAIGAEGEYVGPLPCDRCGGRGTLPGVTPVMLALGERVTCNACRGTGRLS